jgi:cytochrome d ubiquinol oxidase subunit II
LNHAGPSNPLTKQVVKQTAVWLQHYQQQPWLMAAPALTFIGAGLVLCANRLQAYKTAWLCSALAIVGTIATVGFSLFPFILPSSSNPSMSLTVWDASSSHLTLSIMLIATAIFLPLIILYTSWIYYVLRGKVTPEYIEHNHHSTY